MKRALWFGLLGTLAIGTAQAATEKVAINLVSADGAPQVRLTGAQGSGSLSSMTDANCIVVLAHGQGNMAAGDMVDILPFDGLT